MDNDSYVDDLDAAIEQWQAGDASGAIARLELLSTKFPEEASVRGMLGGYYWDGGDARKARSHLEAAVSLAPTSRLWALGLFHTYFALDLFVEADAELRRFEHVAESKGDRVEWRELLRDLERRRSSTGNSA